MNSFKAWFVKETLEGIRRYRFLAIGAVFLFFALMDPLMMRFLPLILKSQMGAQGQAFSQIPLFPATREFGFETFLGDLFEMGSLALCLVLGGILSRERKVRGYVIPYSKGASIGGIVLGKAAAYVAFIPLALFPIVFASYFYAGILFPSDNFQAWVPLAAAAANGLYFIYLACVVILMSAIAPSSLAATIMALAVTYGLPALAGLLKWGDAFPSYLALGSKTVAGLESNDFLISALSASASSVLCLLGAVGAMKKAEL